MRSYRPATQQDLARASDRKRRELCRPLNLVAAGLGISLVPELLQRMRMDGVVFRHVAGAAQPKAPLYLASRRSETSAAVRKFLALVKRPAHNA